MAFRPSPHSPPLAGPTWKLLSRGLQNPITPFPQVSQALIRSFSSTARNRLENRVAEKQKLFQEDNDLPVHLKGGGIDNVLYRLTMALCVGGECGARLGLSLQEAFSTWSVEGLVLRLGFGERAD